MIKYKIILCLLLATTFIAASCKKDKTQIPLTELEKLPPITQTGANTFGCLVNGIAWLPNGSKPQTGGPNIQVYVDPTFQGGRFSITGNKYKEPNQFISIGSFKCTSSGLFNFDSSYNGLQFYRNIYASNYVDYSTNDSGIFKKGYINIIRYDLASGIFSGTFEGKLHKVNGSYGDTINITNGRFDVKL
ncbi:MAG: hypothetical protein WKF35_09830 [Ferruginibacter sp.]